MDKTSRDCIKTSVENEGYKLSLIVDHSVGVIHYEIVKDFILMLQQQTFKSSELERMLWSLEHTGNIYPETGMFQEEECDKCEDTTCSNNPNYEGDEE